MADECKVTRSGDSNAVDNNAAASHLMSNLEERILVEGVTATGGPYIQLGIAGRCQVGSNSAAEV